MTTGAIIAGGSASRLAGRLKGLEVIDGARIIDRVAASLRGHTERLVIAPGNLDATGWVRGATIAPDVLPIKASITGLHAALAAAADDIVAIAWDMPFVPRELVGELIRALGKSDAVVPIVDGRPEPLCAAYSRRALEPIAAAVKGGIMKNSDVLATLTNVVWLDEAALARFGEPEIMFFNVNTPTDLTKAEEIARR